MRIGKLRHRVDLEREQQVDPDADDGRRRTRWEPWLKDEPAELVPLSGRDFIAADAKQSQIVARCAVRWRDGYADARLRVRHQGRVYGVAAALPDPTFRGHLTLMLQGGPGDGR